MHTRSSEIADWLRERVTAAGARGLVVGLSGGIDSAVVARLCQIAMGDDVLGAMLPCHSDPQDEADARLTASHFRIPALDLDLGPAYDRLTADLNAGIAEVPSPQRPLSDEIDTSMRVSLANVKARLRMTALYFVANSRNYLVAGTGNRCELTIGYFTKYGDGAADVLPIGDLLKSQVRDLARDLGVPQSLVDKAPSAGLWLGQTDEAEMGFTYDQLERYLADGPEAVPPALALRIERLVRQTAHKRCLAPTPGSSHSARGELL
jgi:NAD+ synthase